MKRTALAVALGTLVILATSFLVSPETSEAQVSYLYSLIVKNHVSLGDDTIVGDAAFTTTATKDTVVITGALATDVYFISMKDTTATKLYTWEAKADTLIVARAFGDGASAAAYEWLRVRPR